MVTPEASHLMQKSRDKAGKARAGGLHSAFFKAAKVSCSQWSKCQGNSHLNKVDKGAAILENCYMNQLQLFANLRNC